MTPTAHTADTGQHAATTLRLLVPVDGSELAAQALPVAMDLCRTLGGELILVRVVPPGVWPYTVAAGYETPETAEKLQDEALREARDYLQQTAAGVRAAGIAVTTRLEDDTPGPGLLDVLSSQHPDLVVMTTHGRTGLARAVLGSVADQVVRSGEAPVLLLRSFGATTAAPSASSALSTLGATQQGAALSNALAPLDGTALAETALFTVGLRLAGPVLREITLLRVADPKDGAAGLTVAEEYLDAARRRLIDRLQEQGRDCRVSRLVRWGSDPAAVIVECAQPDGCDLVLMATRSAAGIGRVVLGDVTDRVLRDGKTPLLLVHRPRS